jgi:hypothetical protein
MPFPHAGTMLADGRASDRRLQLQPIENENSAMEVMNSLLRGEIAAAETYKQALDGLDTDPQAESLRTILREHGDAIRFLHESIDTHGGEPVSSSGAWGFFARTMEGAAKVLGDTAALGALRQGERQGLADYEQALEQEVLPAECRVHIQNTLIPQQRRHIDVLTRLIDAHAN